MKIQIHGHRGCRGIFPENSIPGFLHAITCGCDFLEMDVVIIDGVVVVAHDPFIIKSVNAEDETEAIRNSFLEMTIDELKSHTYGKTYLPKFPDQIKISVGIPTLRETIIEIEKFCTEHNFLNIRYNIEIKSYPEWIGVYQPEPDLVVESVNKIIDEMNISSRVLLQSFSNEVLSLLNKNSEIPFGKILKRSESFDSEAYKHLKLHHVAPHHTDVTKDQVANIHASNLFAIPYTVNDVSDMKRLIDLKVDGIVTDYPGRLAKLIAR